MGNEGDKQQDRRSAAPTRFMRCCLLWQSAHAALAWASRVCCGAPVQWLPGTQTNPSAVGASLGWQRPAAGGPIIWCCCSHGAPYFRSECRTTPTTPICPSLLQPLAHALAPCLCCNFVRSAPSPSHSCHSRLGDLPSRCPPDRVRRAGDPAVRQLGAPPVARAGGERGGVKQSMT